MKLLLTAILAVSTFNVVFSQCDSRGVTGLKRCYNNMLKSLDVPFSRNITEMLNTPKMQSMDQSTFCKIYNEKNKCLGEYEKNCINVIAFSNAFGTNAYQSMEFLMIEYFSQYMCSSNKDFSKSQCKKFDNAALVNKCSYLKSSSSGGCESVSSALKCFDDAIAEQCNDKEYVEYISKGIKYMIQKVVPFCGL